MRFLEPPKIDPELEKIIAETKAKIYECFIVDNDMLNSVQADIAKTGVGMVLARNGQLERIAPDDYWNREMNTEIKEQLVQNMQQLKGADMTVKDYVREDPFGDRYYLIKNGMYYRADSKGYTSSMMEAGLFGEAYATEHCQNTEGVQKELVI